MDVYERICMYLCYALGSSHMKIVLDSLATGLVNDTIVYTTCVETVHQQNLAILDLNPLNT